MPDWAFYLAYFVSFGTYCGAYALGGEVLFIVKAMRISLTFGFLGLSVKYRFAALEPRSVAGVIEADIVTIDRD